MYHASNITFCFQRHQDIHGQRCCTVAGSFSGAFFCRNIFTYWPVPAPLAANPISQCCRPHALHVTPCKENPTRAAQSRRVVSFGIELGSPVVPFCSCYGLCFLLQLARNKSIPLSEGLTGPPIMFELET